MKGGDESQNGPRDITQASRLAGTECFYTVSTDLNCEVCQLTKTTRAPCRNRTDAEETHIVVLL